MIKDNTKLVPAICTQCGGQIEVNPSQEKAVCKYCGTSFFVEKAIQNYNIQNAKIEHVESMNIKKRAVKSVLNFIEGHQDKKQQKIDEEKRRQEEEKRRQEEKKKQEERKKKIINQLFNKQYRKRNLGII